MDIPLFHFEQLFWREWELQAGTGEEPPFVAFMKPRSYVWRGCPQPCQPGGMHQFPVKWHERSFGNGSQLQEEGVEFSWSIA